MSKAIIEVTIDDSDGNVELKAHNPGKKGATLELRRINEYDYVYVEKLKDFLCEVFDAFMEEDVDFFETKDIKAKMRKKTNVQR